jgi:hypothetical protein
MAAALGGVWESRAPLKTSAPYVLYGRLSGSDVLTMNATRVFTHILMQIKCVGPASNYDTLIIIANRIDALFKKVDTQMLSSGVMLGCYREQELAYPEPALVNGQDWSNLGGLFHIQLQGS